MEFFKANKNECGGNSAEKLVPKRVEDSYNNMLQDIRDKEDISEEYRVDAVALLLKSFDSAMRAFGNNVKEGDLESMLRNSGFKNVEEVLNKYDEYNKQEKDDKNYY